MQFKEEWVYVSGFLVPSWDDGPIEGSCSHCSHVQEEKIGNKAGFSSPELTHCWTPSVKIPESVGSSPHPVYQLWEWWCPSRLWAKEKIILLSKWLNFVLENCNMSMCEKLCIWIYLQMQIYLNTYLYYMYICTVYMFTYMYVCLCIHIHTCRFYTHKHMFRDTIAR